MIKRKRTVLAVMMGVLVATSAAFAAWTGSSTYTTVGKVVSPNQDITGYVGYVDQTRLNDPTLEARLVKYVSRNSGHSFGPASGHLNTDTAVNTIEVQWGSSSASDPVQLGHWKVYAVSWQDGVSSVTNGATYFGMYTNQVSDVKVLQYSSGGTKDFSPAGPFGTSGVNSYVQNTLVNNMAWPTTTEPSGPTGPAIANGSTGMAPGFDPALKLTVEVKSSLTHRWTHPPEVASYVAVLANLYWKVAASILRTP